MFTHRAVIYLLVIMRKVFKNAVSTRWRGAKVESLTIAQAFSDRTITGGFCLFVLLFFSTA